MAKNIIWRKHFSLRTLLIAVTLACLVVAIGRAWLFPPELAVLVSSTGELRIDNREFDSDSLEARLAEFVNERQGWLEKSHMVIIADPVNTGGRSEAIDQVARLALDMNFAQVRMEWNDFDLKHGD